MMTRNTKRTNPTTTTRFAIDIANTFIGLEIYRTMSLPWRFSTAEEYVDGTIIKLQSQNSRYKHLSIGKYYLHGSELDEHQILLLLVHAKENTILTDLSLCGISIGESSSPTHSALVQLLSPPPREWKKVSFNCCRGTGVRAIAAPSLIEFLRISNCHIAREEVTALGVHLQLNRNLQQLELFEEDLRGDHMLDSFQEGLSITHSLKSLEFSYCQFDTEGITVLAKGIEQNSSLTSFTCPGCELEDTQVATLIRSLSGHPTMQIIKIFRNHCGQLGAIALAELLGKQNSQTSSSFLTSIDLSYQQFERAKKLDLGLISASLATNNILKTLSLSFNKLNDADAELLSFGLRENSTLEELDLRANNIRDAGATAIAENLVARASLKKLFLFGNPIGTIGSHALLQAIRPNLEMEILNMDYNMRDYHSIQFFTCLNRAGRRICKSFGFDPRLWPIVFSRAKKISHGPGGVCTHADTIYHLIRGAAHSFQLSKL